MRIHIFYLLLAIAGLSACNKENPIPPVTDPNLPYQVVINNEMNELQGRYAVWLSDDIGNLKAFRWIPGNDTAHLEVPGSKASDLFQCTIVRIFPFETPGSGLRDTTITLTTYTDLAHGQTINLRNLAYKRTTDLSFFLTGINSFDSIIVADGLTFSRPYSNNNYYGQYQVEHTGRIWFRVLVNNEMLWRYLYFDNVTENTLELNQVDVNLMTINQVQPTKIVLPFTAPWKYKVDGVVDSASLQFVPLGDLRRAPGGAEQVISTLQVFEPVANADFMPEPKPYNTFRLQASGNTNDNGGYTFYSDGFYPALPGQLNAPGFDLQPTLLSDNRAVAVRCIGDFDLLAFTRNYTSNPLKINWEVLVKPGNGTIADHRLPDVPNDLGRMFSPLGNFQFGNIVHVRAENYTRLFSYDAVILKRLQNSDPLWQAKAGYTGREESY